MPTLKTVLILSLLCLPAETRAIQFTSTLSSIRVQARPGEVVDRNFQLQLTPDQPATRFHVKLEDWWTSQDGRQSFYRPVGTLARSCGPWAAISPLTATVAAGGALRVQVRLSLPRTITPGGYWCVLTVDEVADPLTAPAGVAVQFLTSISVGVFVYVTPIERAAVVESVEVGDREVAVTIANAGNAPLAVQGRIEFLRVGQQTPIATVLLPRSTVLLDPAPRRTLRVALPDVETLPVGRYLVRAIIDIGLDHYLGVQKELEIRRATSGKS